MSIDHDPGDGVGFLEAATGEADRPAALLESTFPTRYQLAATGTVKFAASAGDWVVFCAAAPFGQVQLVISVAGGDLKQACEDVWQGFRKAAKELHPKLNRLQIVDPSSTSPVGTGQTGARALLGQTEIKLALWPGVLTAVVVGGGLGFGLITDKGAVVLAGAPAVLVTLVAILFVVLPRVKNQHLVWTG